MHVAQVLEATSVVDGSTAPVGLIADICCFHNVRKNGLLLGFRELCGNIVHLTMDGEHCVVIDIVHVKCLNGAV